MDTTPSQILIWKTYQKFKFRNFKKSTYYYDTPSYDWVHKIWSGSITKIKVDASDKLESGRAFAYIQIDWQAEKMNRQTDIRSDTNIPSQNFIEQGYYKHVATTLTLYVLNFADGNISIYLHLISLLHIDMTQVLKILPQVRPGPTYSTNRLFLALARTGQCLI